MSLSTTPRSRAHVLLLMMVVMLVSGLLKSGLLWASDTKRHVLEPLLAFMRSCSCCFLVLQVHLSTHVCAPGPHSRTYVNSHSMFLTPQTDSRVFGNKVQVLVHTSAQGARDDLVGADNVHGCSPSRQAIPVAHHHHYISTVSTPPPLTNINMI